MATNLAAEYAYYQDNKADFLKRHKGRFLAIKGQHVLGVYRSEIEAIRETVKTHEIGTFLIQPCVPGKDADKQIFHSRVAFA